MANIFSGIPASIIMIMIMIKALVDAQPKYQYASKDDNKVLTTWDDLAAGGLSRHDLIQLYERNYGRPPHAVYLNGGICKEYGKYCYNILSDIAVLKKSIEPRNIVGDEKTLNNDSEQEATFSVTLEATHEKSAKLTVTKASSFSYKEAITISAEDILSVSSEFSYEFKIENSVSSESTTSDTVTVKDSINLTLQPNSSVIVRLDVKWLEEKSEIEIPINVVGHTGGDYPEPLDGHYYWFPWLKDWVQLTSSMHANVISSYDIKGEITLQNLD